jgi:hypothetical protein
MNRIDLFNSRCSDSCLFFFFFLTSCCWFLYIRLLTEREFMLEFDSYTLPNGKAIDYRMFNVENSLITVLYHLGTIE